MRSQRIWTLVPCRPLSTEKVKEWGGLFGDTPEIRRQMCEACEYFGGYMYGLNNDKIRPTPYKGFRCYADNEDHPWCEDFAEPEVCEFWEKKEDDD